MKFFYRFLFEEDAPTFMEYALLIALIAAIVVGSATVLGDTVGGFFTTTHNTFP